MFIRKPDLGEMNITEAKHSSTRIWTVFFTGKQKRFWNIENKKHWKEIEHAIAKIYGLFVFLFQGNISR